MAYLEVTSSQDQEILRQRYQLKLPSRVEVKRQTISVKCVLVSLFSITHWGSHCLTCVSVVSQTEGSEELRSRGLEIVGWYHSHPTFPALPSLRDLNTQVTLNS